MEYGNPSGHSLIFLCFYGTVVRMCVKDKRLHLPVYIICGYLGWSRFALGVHSLDQICNGLVQGLIFMLYFSGSSFQDYITRLDARMRCQDTFVLKKFLCYPMMAMFLTIVGTFLIGLNAPDLTEEQI